MKSSKAVSCKSETGTKMSKKRNESKRDRGISLLVSIILVFFILCVIVFAVSKKITTEMAASATQNLNESLDLIQCTIEAILNKEAEYQRLMAQGFPGNCRDGESGRVCPQLSKERNHGKTRLDTVG